MDLREPALHEFDPATGRDETWAMPAFGGEALGTVFVTSATWPLSEEERRRRPQEGGLFAFTVPVPGMPATHVRLAE